MRTPDLAGLRVGRLLVVEMRGKRGPRREWLCRCNCGSEILITTSRLTGNSPTLSCGCITRERVSSEAHRAVMLANTITHGRSKTPTYTSWCDMIQRCTNPKREKYARYGGRGITVCRRWMDSFENFLADMGERPTGTTIDRIDNDGNYEPDNCRWSSPREQSINSSKTKLSEQQVREIQNLAASGESQRDIARRFGVTDGHVNNIIAHRAWRDVR